MDNRLTWTLLEDVHNHVKVVRNVEKEQEEELKKLIGEELWEKLEGKNEDSRS